MKKLMSVVVSILFALSLSGLAFAQAAKEAKPAADPAKAEEKDPAKEKNVNKAKAKKAKADEKAPAPEKK